MAGGDTKPMKRCLFYPQNPKTQKENRCLMTWEMANSLVLLVTCMLTPFNLAFSHLLDEHLSYLWVNYAIDIFFAIDILVIFNTAIWNESFEIIDSRCAIAKDYLRTWFLVDLLSILPFEVIIMAFTAAPVAVEGAVTGGEDAV